MRLFITYLDGKEQNVNVLVLEVSDNSLTWRASADTTDTVRLEDIKTFVVRKTESSLPRLSSAPTLAAKASAVLPQSDDDHFKEDDNFMQAAKDLAFLLEGKTPEQAQAVLYFAFKRVKRDGQKSAAETLRDRAVQVVKNVDMLNELDDRMHEYFDK